MAVAFFNLRGLSNLLLNLFPIILPTKTVVIKLNERNQSI